MSDSTTLLPSVTVDEESGFRLTHGVFFNLFQRLAADTRYTGLGPLWSCLWLYSALVWDRHCFLFILLRFEIGIVSSYMFHHTVWLCMCIVMFHMRSRWTYHMLVSWSCTRFHASRTGFSPNRCSADHHSKVPCCSYSLFVCLLFPIMLY